MYRRAAHLHGDEPVVNLHLLCQKVGPNGRLVLAAELLVDILVHKRRLADAAGCTKQDGPVVAAQQRSELAPRTLPGTVLWGACPLASARPGAGPTARFQTRPPPRNARGEAKRHEQARRDRARADRKLPWPLQTTPHPLSPRMITFSSVRFLLADIAGTLCSGRLDEARRGGCRHTAIKAGCAGEVDRPA